MEKSLCGMMIRNAFRSCPSCNLDIKAHADTGTCRSLSRYFQNSDQVLVHDSIKYTIERVFMYGLYIFRSVQTGGMAPLKLMVTSDLFFGAKVTRG